MEGVIRWRMAVPENDNNKPSDRRATSSRDLRSRKTRTSCRRWNDLPEDLVGEIMVRLSPPDRIRFSACCHKFWRLMPHYNRDIDQLPWWVKPHRESDLPFGYAFNLFDPVHETPYSSIVVDIFSTKNRFTIEKSHKTTLLASNHGWLLWSWRIKVLRLASFDLISPFSSRLITLPNFEYQSEQDQVRYSSKTMVAAFSAQPSSPDCVYFVLGQTGDYRYVRISTFQNGDREWKTVQFDTMISSLFIGVVYYEGSFYCCARNGRDIAAYDVAQKQWSLVKRAKPTKESRNRILGRWKLYPYLLVCEGKLLFVQLYIPKPIDENDKREDQFLVFEYDQERDWVEKTSLGDHALFLCCHGSFSVLITSSSMRDLANRIYYYGKDVAKNRYYSLVDGKTYPSGSSYWPGEESGGTWIEPPHVHATQRPI